MTLLLIAAIFFGYLTTLCPACSDHNVPLKMLVAQQATTSFGRPSWRDEDGNEVRLKGTNLGSWLLLEPWMLDAG